MCLLWQERAKESRSHILGECAVVSSEERDALEEIDEDNRRPLHIMEKVGTLDNCEKTTACPGRQRMATEKATAVKQLGPEYWSN